MAKRNFFLPDKRGNPKPDSFISLVELMMKKVKINFLTKNNLKLHHITFTFLKLFGIYKLFII